MIDLHNKLPKLLVIGDLMIDHYLWGACERVSTAAPVQIVNVNDETTSLGGAGNVVNNLKALGAKVDVISVVGDGKNSDALKALLDDIGVDTKYLITQKNRTGSKKSRIIASQQQVVRYDRESTDEIDIESQNTIIETFNKIVKDTLLSIGYAVPGLILAVGMVQLMVGLDNLIFSNLDIVLTGSISVSYTHLTLPTKRIV